MFKIIAVFHLNLILEEIRECQVVGSYLHDSNELVDAIGG